MKKITIIGTFLILCQVAICQKTIETTVENLKKSALYNESLSFKNTFEKQTEALGKKVQSIKDYQTLQKKYTDVSKPYDTFLKEMKKDLLKNNSKSTSASYVEKWEKVKKEYNQNFLSYHNAQIGGKGISDELLKIGKDFLVTTFNNIRQRVKDKNETLNTILSFVNDNFFNKIELKTWTELNISPKSIGDSTTILPQNQPLEIPVATLGALAGKILFAKVENGQDLPMDFILNQGKDIVIETNLTKTNQTNTVAQTTGENIQTNTYKAPYLESVENHTFGTKFKLKSEASSFVYIIVLNSNGVVLLHPSVNYAQSGKDITISTENNPTVGSLTIPANGLFTITKSGNDSDGKPSEDFAILISKSELNLTDLIEKMNASNGSLDERIAIIFADQQITYQEAAVNIAASEIQFQYGGEKNVLPLVFKINKQL